MIENTGTWNSDLVTLWALCLMAPVALWCALNVICAMLGPSVSSGSPKPYLAPTFSQTTSAKKRGFLWPLVEEEVSVTETVTTTEEIIEPPSTSETQAWEQVKLAAISQAMEGHSGAREWVTRHVFNKNKPAAAAEPESLNNEPDYGPMIKSVVASLSPLGFRPADLKSTIKTLVSTNTYQTAEELLEDVVKSM